MAGQSQPEYTLAELCRILNAVVRYGVVTTIHEREARAKASVETAAARLPTPFLPVIGRKRGYIRSGERVMLVAQQGKPEQGVLIPLGHDPEQDEQNRRIKALEACCETMKQHLNQQHNL